MEGVDDSCLMAESRKRSQTFESRYRPERDSYPRLCGAGVPLEGSSFSRPASASSALRAHVAHDLKRFHPDRSPRSWPGLPSSRSSERVPTHPP